MYACLECGVRLPPRSKGGHRERQYCSPRCRQRAYRQEKKRTQEIERLITGEYLIPGPPAPYLTRELWRSERESLLAHYRLMEAQLRTAEAEIRVLEGDNSRLKGRLADKEAEIARLTFLLESQARRKH